MNSKAGQFRCESTSWSFFLSWFGNWSSKALGGEWLCEAGAGSPCLLSTVHEGPSAGVAVVLIAPTTPCSSALSGGREGPETKPLCVPARFHLCLPAAYLSSFS